MQKPSLAWWATCVAGIALIAAIWFWYEPGKRPESQPERVTASESGPAGERPPQKATPRKPIAPVAANVRNAEGAKAFLSYYLEVYNYTQATADSTLLKSLYSEDCAACLIELDRFKKIREKKGRIDGGEFILTSVDKVTVNGDAFFVPYVYDRRAAQLLDETGTSTGDSAPEYKNEQAYISLWWNGSWKIVSFGGKQ